MSAAEQLSFLSAVSRLAISPMGDLVAREVAKSKRSSEIETSRARQAHYIEWCTSISIKDPVGLEDGWKTLVAIYIKCVMTGVNYLNKETVRSATCRAMLFP